MHLLSAIVAWSLRNRALVLVATALFVLFGLRSATQLPMDAVPDITESVSRLVAELGSTPLIGFAGAPFTLASYLVEGGPSRTHEHTKALMHGDPQLWNDLCERLAQISGAFLRVQVEAGASAVQARRLIRSGSSLVSTRVARAACSSPLVRTGA